MELFTHLTGASFMYEDVYYNLEDKLHEGFPTMEELETVISHISVERIQTSMIELGYKIINEEIDDYIKNTKKTRG